MAEGATELLKEDVIGKRRTEDAEKCETKKQRVHDQKEGRSGDELRVSKEREERSGVEDLRVSKEREEVEGRERDSEEGGGNEVRGFEFLEHPADVQLHAWSVTFGDAVAALVESLFHLLTDSGAVQECYSMDVRAEAEHEEALVFNALQEALFHFQAEPFFIGRRVELLSNDESSGALSIALRGHGESFDSQKHCQKSDVKAPTYSNMQIIKKDGRVDIFVIVDV